MIGNILVALVDGAPCTLVKRSPCWNLKQTHKCDNSKARLHKAVSENPISIVFCHFTVFST